MNSLLIGVLLTSVVQVSEVIDRVTAVSFIPETHQELTQYLNEIDNRATPVIFINSFYNDGTGKFVHSAQRSLDLKNAIASSSHFGRTVLAFDEFLHNGRNAGQDIDSILEVMRLIKADFPTVEFAHIEAFAELYKQYTEYNGQLKLFYEADHIGFDCYGAFDSCGGFGVPELPQMTYLSIIYNQIQLNNSAAKIFLVAGSFIDNFMYSDVGVVRKQLYDYAWLAEQNKDYISGLGIFSWGSLEWLGIQITGARDIPALKDATEHVLDMMLVNDYDITGVQ